MEGCLAACCGGMSAVQREAVGMPAAGVRLTFATLLGAADALVIESVEDDVVILSDGYGLHEGARRARGCTTASASGTSASASASATTSRPSARGSRSRLSERSLLGEERHLPRVAVPPRRHGAARRRLRGIVLGQRARRLAGRRRPARRRRLRRGRPHRHRSRRRHRRGDQRARRGRRPRRRSGRRRRPRAHRGRLRRRRPAPRRARRAPAATRRATASRWPEPLPALREALAAARRTAD